MPFYGQHPGGVMIGRTPELMTCVPLWPVCRNQKGEPERQINRMNVAYATCFLGVRNPTETKAKAEAKAKARVEGKVKTRMHRYRWETRQVQY